jgi:GT2 family glycosyltransferase
VIATHGRPTLLARTLQSLGDCVKPMAYAGIVVIENGLPAGARKVVDSAPGNLKARYMHTPVANKSGALNAVLDTVAEDLIIFLDDDVRVEADLLLQYAAAADGIDSGYFFGGPVSVDYEHAPPEWLRPLLPTSARGWELSDGMALRRPFLGFNWAAFAPDLRRAGGFDTSRGPGAPTGSTGQETAMQQALMQIGAKAVYVPGARVWHYVPRNRCSPEWAIERAVSQGIERGIMTYRDGWTPQKKAKWMMRVHVRSPMRIGLAHLLGSEQRRFRAEYWRRHDRAFLDGVRIGRELALSRESKTPE